MAMRHLSRSRDVRKRSTKKYIEEPLYHRLFKNGGTEVSVRQQLNQFLKGTKHVFKWEVGDTIKKLRNRGLYYPALKILKRKVAFDAENWYRNIKSGMFHLFFLHYFLRQRQY